MEAVLQERHSIFKERELQRQKEEAQEKLAHRYVNKPVKTRRTILRRNNRDSLLRKMMVEIKKSLIEKFDQKKDEKLRRNLKRREKEVGLSY
jgi:hypothetical protein